jgi:NAD(P)-dependent dehydrogenase (short-subunit alcohol dehydrogenase family)
VAIVTGAGRGIGRGYARALAKEGARVVVNDFGSAWDGSGRDDRPAQQVVDEIVADGGVAIADYGDVADWGEGHRLIDLAVEQFGRLDILICNAGILRDRMLFNLGEEEWDQVVRVHLKGHFVPTRAAARHWRALAKESGDPANASVVFTSSSSGLYGNAGQLNYDAAKAGIAGMAVAAARELSGYGVRVNAVSPSARTRLTEQTFETDQRSGSTESFDAMDPDNVAPWVTFLCTDEARDISGQVFEVRGGLVQRVEGWHRTAEISQARRWSLDELEIQAKALFNGQPTGPPPMPHF